MNNNYPIQANIVEIDDGPYYQVLMITTPHVGEIIELRSRIEETRGEEPYHKYQVLQVVHNVWDLQEELDAGYHKVNIYVKPV